MRNIRTLINRKRVLISTVILLTLPGLLLLYGAHSDSRLPDDSPSVFLESGQRGDTVVVTIGDSITHGSLSANYVKTLEMEFPSTEYRFINVGINAELVYNVIQRLDEIIACDPDTSPF